MAGSVGLQIGARSSLSLVIQVRVLAIPIDVVDDPVRISEKGREELDFDLNQRWY